MPLFGRIYPKIFLADVQGLLADLDLEIVGGLKQKGSTTNNIDVVGDKNSIYTFAKRLNDIGIVNPVHYCGHKTKHSHIQCIYYGVKLALTGRGY